MAYDGSIKIDTKLDTSGLQKGVSNLIKSLKTIGVATAAALGSAAYAGMKFESAFAGVKKTVDATDAQLSQLRDGIRDMAKELPTSANEIAGVAEAAGQLGIQTDNILAFSKTMTMLGDATNMTAETAATTLARFANITGMTQDNFDRLGSTIVALGNNFATTEAEIADMGMNIASAGTQVGMTEAQIMGFATALSSVGMEAQAGGTAISKLMIDMQLATETGGESLQQFANVAGVSAEEFATAFKTDAAGAITKFITGLNDTDRHGKTAIAVLDEMGISEVRLRDAILRAANSGDLFTKAIKTGTDAWEDNTALTKEAEQRYETLESKLGMLKNNLIDLGISIYDGISEPLKDAVSGAIEQLGGLSASIKGGDLKKAISGIGEAFGSLVSIVSKIVSAVLPPLISILGVLGNNIDSVVVSFTALFVAVKGYQIFASISGILRSATSAIQAMTLASTELQAAETRGITISALKMKYDAAAVATLSAKQIAVSVLTGKTTLLTAAKALATKAQLALNAAWAANPVGVVIAGVAALAAGLYVLVKAVSKESEEEKAAREEREKYIESINQEIEKSNELIQQAQELSVKRTETKESAEAEAYANKQLTDQLFELSEKENKSIGDKLLMKDIVGQLNSSMQDLNLQFDEETGQLSMTREEIYKTIEAKKQLAIQNAAMEFMTESYKKQFELTAEQNRLLAQEEDLKAKIAENEARRLEINKEARENGNLITKEQSEELNKINLETKEYKNTLEEIKPEIKDVGKQLEETSLEIEEANKIVEEAHSGASNTTKKTTDEIKKSWLACSYEYEKTSNGMLDAANAFYTQMESDAGSYGADFMAAWKTAIDKGAFDSATSVTDMFNIVLGIMQTGSQSVGETGGNVPQTFYDSFMSKSSLMSDAATEGSTQAADSADSTSTTLFPGVGLSAAAGFAKGIRDNIWMVQEAAGEMATAADEAAKGKLKTNSPSKVFRDGAGKSVPEGMALGITENAGLVAEASKNMAEGSVTAAKKAIDSNSPSKRFERQVGKTIPQGVALGIKKNSYEVTDAVKQMFDDLELQKEIGALSEAEYYEKLAEYRDQYLEQGTKEWWDYTKEILDYDEKMVDQQFKNLDWLHDNNIISEAQYYQKLAELRDEYFSESDEEWQDYTQQIAEYYMDTVNEIKDKFSELGSVAQEKTYLKANGEEGGTYLQPNDYAYATKQLITWTNEMEKLKEKAGDDATALSIYEEVLAMDIEEGIEMAKMYNAMSGPLREHEWEQKLEEKRAFDKAAEDAAKMLTGINGQTPSLNLDLETISEETKAVGETAGEALIKGINTELEEFDPDWDAWFEGVPEQAFNMGAQMIASLRDGALSEIENFKTAISEKLTSTFSELSIGLSGGGGAATYSKGGDTYNFYSSKSTVTEQLKAAEDQSVINRLRGWWTK